MSFTRKSDGRLAAKRGAGGLVSSLAPLVRGREAVWLAAALSDADREAATSGMIEAEGFRFRSLAVDVDTFRMFYDVVANSTLWFLYHGLFDLARRPRLDRHWRKAWDAYRSVNQTFAQAVIDDAPEGAIVLVQDYHFALVGTWLAQKRPDLRAVHFSHVPFCDPTTMRVLPTDVAVELLVGMTSHLSCGFHSKRWAANFTACCSEILGFEPDTFVSPLTPDTEDLARVAASEECAKELRHLEEQVGTRKLILRVDRIELSKNVLRGFWAYDELLELHPEWRGHVVFAALVYPSRDSLPEYLAYRQEVEALARLLNDKWGTLDWTPVIVDTADNFPHSVAALRRYDVLLVNPIRDGLNLVAKEGPLLNERNGVLVLSREAGVWEELGGVAIGINPFDVSGTASALAAALSLAPDERAKQTEAVRQASRDRSPRDWLDDQIRAAAEHRVGVSPPLRRQAGAP
ncbi:MAG: trehalose-6-phosphate synthase [Actinomycetota bacterium]|nr:trehalose-6-phosphate synthase [Actinomycetota bacterium]